jgi:hypothetical protein
MEYAPISHWEIDRRRSGYSHWGFTHRPSRWRAEVALAPHARSLGKLVEVSRTAWHGWWGFFDNWPVIANAGIGVAAFGAVGLMLYHCAGMMMP